MAPGTQPRGQEQVQADLVAGRDREPEGRAIAGPGFGLAWEALACGRVDREVLAFELLELVLVVEPGGGLRQLERPGGAPGVCVPGAAGPSFSTWVGVGVVTRWQRGEASSASTFFTCSESPAPNRG